ncbi:MAG: 16S rRNA (uracil(1498)-N(3))-methyltransferase [Phycisphaeraceae bacterium]|nr:16S rRNA (uracil(1498)-N(3))-methyltransferase [Phycisphaeraceae bacterium]
MHRMIVDGDAGVAEGALVIVTGEEARHAARVKRVDEGEAVELMDGRGMVASGVVEQADAGRGGRKSEREPAVAVRVGRVRRESAVSPRVEVWTAAPKGGRVDEMVELLSQVGAAAWVPVRMARSVVKPGETKLARLERIALEAMKQCGRAWVMEVGAERGLEEALRGREGVEVVVADASGDAYEGVAAREVRLVVGPEGGFTESELLAAREAGARIARFGPHVMRIETAAAAGAAVVLNAAGGAAR